MRVTGRGRDFLMAEQPPNHGQALPQCQRPARIRVTEVAQEAEGGGDVGRTRRPGYDRLLATVRRSELGMVLSLKASRLAPNGRKWHIGHLNPRGTATFDQRP